MMNRIVRTAKEYWGFFDLWNNQQARKTPRDKRTILRLKATALIAEDRGL